MKFKTGDKVKFLNSSGGGIITKIVNSTMVNVAIEDGFEIPTLISELVKIENESSASKIFNQDFKIEKDTITNTVHENEQENKSKLIKSYSNSNQTVDGIYLAFVPHDQKWLITGNIDIYLINHTNFHIIYSFNIKQDFYYGIDYDVLEPESKKLITTIEREEIDEWNNGNIQVLYHSEKSEKLLQPLNADFKIKTSRFIKEENYINSSFIKEKSLIITLSKLIENIVTKIDTKTKNNDDFTIKKAQIHNPESVIDTHLINEETAEIDLHIGELAEDYYLLTNSEIMNIQLNYFIKSLDAAMIKKIKKLIFIHGVGNGTLKSEIVKILKTYDNIHYFDASIAKYGVGATEVYIHHNK